MKHWFQQLGWILFAGFLMAGLTAWAVLPSRVTIVFGDGASASARGSASPREVPPIQTDLGLVEQQLTQLQEQLGQLQAAIGPAFDTLSKQQVQAGLTLAGFQSSIGERFAALEVQMAALRNTVIEQSAQVPQEAPRSLGEVGESAAAAATEIAEVTQGSLSEPAAEPSMVQEPESSQGMQVVEAMSFADLLARSEQAKSVSLKQRYDLMEGGSKVGFDGSSNLHDFSGSTTAVTGFLQFDWSDPAVGASGEIQAEARSLDTGNSSRDASMHADHLRSELHPQLRFLLQRITEVESLGSGRFKAIASGEFHCHGQHREVQLGVLIERPSRQVVRVSGEWPLRMSHYGIDPPKAMGGLIKTEDEVTAWFYLQAKAAQ